ncbi:hypothetical protein LV475_05415 [Guyparkeria hydrothermalis]|uniref:pilus assembly protein n=1 Tax=Guyparkeria hydrothermalis TaxID=923 RepID=UPI002022856C|nr:PilC/PilY family type IV pilus protein [Guyparkeria hydrothermalis]MCL7751032.1 hypothetical protein [Guyparkeria hydrothermalis]
MTIFSSAFDLSRRGLLTFVSAMTLSLLTGTAAAAVDVSQSPLIVSEPLPPNIVLLHDDSGSMARNYMPDGLSSAESISQDPAENGVYYDPNARYPAPPTATGNTYLDVESFPWAPTDVFGSTSVANIESYTSRFDYWTEVNYSGGCPSNTQSSSRHDGYCYRDTRLSSIEDEFAFRDPGNDLYYYYGGGSRQVFTYRLDGESYYVTGSCERMPADEASRCSDSDADKQNVANWFTYYRTRELAAKSGIMSAFGTLDPSFRFGFGAINDSNSGDLGSGQFDYFMKVKEVEPFGDGASGTQRERFWNWLEGVGANGGTPLRRALDTAGRYYQTSQPWLEGGEEYSCRQSYTILVSDGYWSGSAPSTRVNRSDNTSTDNYDAVDPFVGGNADDGSATLADVANYYWKTDLRDDTNDPGQDNRVPATPNDPATWQHMTTFTVGLGLSVTGLGATESELFDWARNGDQDAIDNWNGWPTPGDGNGQGEPENVSDMLHAAINGHGDFFSARNPQEFAAGLRAALAAIDSQRSAGGSQTVSSLQSGETLVDGSRAYSATYFTSQWTGELTARGYNPDTEQFDQVLWNGAGGIPAHGSRNIWTTVAGQGNTPTAPAKFMTGELDNDQVNALVNNVGGGITVDETTIVNYLRGDRSEEGNDLRQRITLLGDIVTSTPVAIGAPDPGVFGDSQFEGIDEYETFVTDQADRDTLVYIAANDGMLHAFDAETGEEVFAYIPGAVLTQTGDSSLSRLANPEYGIVDPVDGDQPVPHQYFHDGEMTTQNVYLDGGWKTILVGTTGRGQSRTVYALDITDPSVLSDADSAGDAILWERSAGDGESNDEYIGMALGRPTIALVQGNGNNTEWVVHVGNGPNSDSDRAALLQFDLEDGDLTVYDAGNATDNGLAAPYVIQTDASDGLSDYAFAGDLQGNLWQFPLSASGGTAERIFVAEDDDGNAQPITARMLAARNPNDGSIWAFFGTGRFLSRDDITDTSVQTWYGLRVMGPDGGPATVDDTTGRGDLQERTIDAEETVGGNVGRATSTGSAADLAEDDDAGWYMDLVSPVEGEEGERIVYTTQLIAGRLVVNTLIPKADDPCDTLPAGALMIVEPFSGANPNTRLLDVNGDGVIGDDELSSGGVYFNGIRFDVGLAGALTAAKDSDGNLKLLGGDLAGDDVNLEMSGGAAGAMQRLNWRELYIQ